MYKQLNRRKFSVNFSDMWFVFYNLYYMLFTFFKCQRKKTFVILIIIFSKTRNRFSSQAEIVDIEDGNRTNEYIKSLFCFIRSPRHIEIQRCKYVFFSVYFCRNQRITEF